MITYKQLRIYRMHWGSGDLLIREGTPAEIEALTTNDAWRLIEQLVQTARRLARDQPAPAVAAELQAHLQRHTADEATRRLLRQLGRAYPRIRPRLPLFLFQSLILGIFMAVVLVANGLAALLNWMGESPGRRWVAKLLLLLISWLLYKLGLEYLLHWLTS